VRRITDLVEELTSQRAEDRIGTRVEVLLTEALGDGEWVGHAAHQDPDADGTTTVTGLPDDAEAGQLLGADVVATEGVDLVARAAVPALTVQR
jgi:ribosomal protein S12 methylthiotransferase